MKHLAILARNNNLFPGLFPLEIGRGGKSPGKEVVFGTVRCTEVKCKMCFQ